MPYPNVAEVVRSQPHPACDVRVGILVFPVWLVTVADPTPSDLAKTRTTAACNPIFHP
jgi:hypothetical protein